IQLALLLRFLLNDTGPSAIYSLSLHDALPICLPHETIERFGSRRFAPAMPDSAIPGCCDALLAVAAELPGLRAAAALEIVESLRSEEHTSELQSRENLVCRLLLEKKKKKAKPLNKELTNTRPALLKRLPPGQRY